jgi:protein-tyrosine-phosphatase
MSSILFVCTANRFRSPIAAAILTKVLKEEQRPEVASLLRRAGPWQVGSAGTWATPGQPVLAEVNLAAGQLGLDLSSHRSQCVSGELLAEYDLILTMQASQKEALQAEFAPLADSIYLLSDVIERGSYDIPDLYGSEREALEVALKLNELIRRGRERICVLAGALHNERYRTP